MGGIASGFGLEVHSDRTCLLPIRRQTQQIALQTLVGHLECLCQRCLSSGTHQDAVLYLLHWVTRSWCQSCEQTLCKT